MMLRRVGVLSVGMVMGTLYALIGLVGGAFFTLVSLVGMAAQVPGGGDTVIFGISAIIVLPILYGVMGFIGGIIVGALYNLVAGLIGGIEMHFESTGPTA